jgi:hypothetical protein
VAAVYDREAATDTAYFYLNGVFVGSESSGLVAGNPVSGTDDVGIGTRDGLVRALMGYIDEIRISDTVRSQGWIATEHNNMSDTATGSDKFIRSVGPEEAVLWWDTGWQNRKTLTINADMVGVNSVPKDNSDLEDMPVLFSFTDTEIGGNAQSSGKDIAFTLNGISSKLDHELVSFDSATGEIITWVKIPAISSSSDTALDIYYGNSSAPDQQKVEDTWFNGYEGVWHLEEDVRGSGGAYQDSSPNGRAGTSGAIVVGGPPTQTTVAGGRIGRAQDYDGTDDYIDAGSDSSLDDLPAITFTAWIKRTADNPSHNLPRIFNKAGAQDARYKTFYFG